MLAILRGYCKSIIVSYKVKPNKFEVLLNVRADKLYTISVEIEEKEEEVEEEE